MQMLAALTLAAQAATAPVHASELRGEELMKALQSGGYTIVLRHARTDWSFREAMGTIPADRSAQRNLSADGVRDAALMGVVLRRYRIPIDEIVASPMFRTRETAEYAAGTPSVAMALRVFPTTGETAALVAAAPKPGTNRLLVTHHFVIEKHVPGIKPGDIGESEAVVVRPSGAGRVELVGRIKLADWERLAGVPETGRPKATDGGQPSVSAHGATPAAEGPVIPVPIPDTPAGRLAQDYIRAFNSGDAVRARAFIDASLLPSPTRSTEERIRSWAQSFQDLGPLTVTGVRTSSADEITLDIRARNREYFLTAKTSAEQPRRAISITIGTTQRGHP